MSRYIIIILLGLFLQASPDLFAAINPVPGYLESILAGMDEAEDGEWMEQAKLIAEDADAGDIFGWSVSISGDYAIVGAWGDDDAGRNSGSACMFSLDDGEWIQQAKLTAEDGDVDDWFGYSVSISGDYAIVGAYQNDDDGEQSGSAYIFSLEDGEWIQQVKLTAEDADGGDYFGYSVSISGDYAIVGASGNGDDGELSGSAYIFSLDDGEWIQQAKLTAEDADEGDRFGQFVSISGDYAIVGAPEDDDDGDDSGSAYIFVRDDGEWIQQAKLTAEDADEQDFFGLSASISGDNAIVGAYNDDDGEQSGSAYIFFLDDGDWTQQAKLTAEDAEAGDHFGYSVSISGDNAIVGAWEDDDDGENSGSAYKFSLDDGEWIQQAKLTADDADAGDFFGNSVSISGDNAIVGAIGDDDSGSAYIYHSPIEDPDDGEDDEEDVDDGEWLEQAKLIADDGAFDDLFGFSSSISGDYAIVGAWGNDDNGDGSGSAYIFSLDDDDEWIQQPKLTAEDARGLDHFGYSVSISGDYAIVGAEGNDDDGERSGSAYIFSLDDGEWIQQAKLTADDADAGDFFGNSVSISGDYAIVGANGDDDDGNMSGSAYIFVRDDGEWIQQAKLTAEDAGGGDQFGNSVSISGDNAIVGAYWDDGSGSAYIFVRNDGDWTQQAKLTAEDADEGDVFGFSVSISGDNAIVGAKDNFDEGFDPPMPASGSAYIFSLNDGEWIQQAKLTAADAAARDYFGNSVSISGDCAIVGAKRDDDNGENSGSAYKFSFDDGEWIQQAKLTADDGGENDRFGYSVSISGDNAIIGAYYGDDGSGSAYIFQHPVVIGIPALPVQFTEGWNLISLNVFPAEEFYADDEDRGPDVIRMTEQLQGEEEHHIVLMKNEAGQFYLPSFDFNSIPYWNLTEGYQVKVDEDIETSWSGEQIPADADVPLEEGWNLIAYYPTYELDASAPDYYVLSPIMDNVLLAKDIEGNFMLPEHNFSNMRPWRESQGYQVKVDDDVTLNYPEEQEEEQNDAIRVERTALTSTGNNMSLLVQGLNANAGSVLSAIDVNNTIVGHGFVNADGQCGLAIWGDDLTTESKDGLSDGESFSLRNGDEVIAPTAYLAGKDLTFKTDGLIVIDAERQVSIPTEYYLSAAFPNPFNNRTTLRYGLPETGQVEINMYDISGRLVKGLGGFEKIAGNHTIDVNASNMGSGLFIVRFEVNGFSSVQKIVLMK